MQVLGAILGIIIIIFLVLLLIVGLPILFGKIFLHWSKQRTKYIFSKTSSTVITSVILSSIITLIGLFIGFVFHQEWAFSGGLLFLYTFWIAIKSTRENIRNSRNL